MRSVVYTHAGEPDVLHIVERPIPDLGPGEVRVAVHVSGVNPTDWKARRGPLQFDRQVPNQDGAGVIDAVGAGIDPTRVGERVWIWQAAWQRADGTAQEYVVLPARQVVPLPDVASFDLGASLGIPALTAHRCLTVGEGGPQRLGPGALSGRTVLVAGGAGVVGNAAIQLARWSGAMVATTISSAEKADLARAAGAHWVIDYRSEKATDAIRAVAPNGVDIIVEVAPAANAELDGGVLGPHGVVAMYVADGEHDPVIPLRATLPLGVRWQGVRIYSVPTEAKDHAVAAVTDAVGAGVLRVGADVGLPLHHFPLERAAEAHAAVENNVIGKVLITIV